MAPVLLFAGYALVIIGGFMLLVAAFRESVLWGLACLFIPIVSLFFLIVHWSEAKSGFLVQLVGLALLIVSLVLAPHGTRIFH